MDIQRVEIDTKAFVEPKARKKDLWKERGVSIYSHGNTGLILFS